MTLKSHPIPIKMTITLRDRVDAMAKERGLSRHAALLLLIDKGLDAVYTRRKWVA